VEILAATDKAILRPLESGSRVCLSDELKGDRKIPSQFPGVGREDATRGWNGPTPSIVESRLP